jgi:hypothetical protein
MLSRGRIPFQIVDEGNESVDNFDLRPGKLVRPITLRVNAIADRLYPQTGLVDEDNEPVR